MVSRLELRQLDGTSIKALRTVAAALDASVSIDVRWRGEQLDRLMDAGHAALQEQVAGLLTSLGWVVCTEVSFNQFGDRGRCDIVAYHPGSGVMLIVEVKTQLGDLQDALGRLDVKARLGAVIARQLGWQAPVAVVPALVLGESGTGRRLLASHAALFARYERRGRAARSWLRSPGQGDTLTGLLWFVRAPDSHGVGISRHARVRQSPDAHH